MERIFATTFFVASRKNGIPVHSTGIPEKQDNLYYVNTPSRFAGRIYYADVANF